MPQLIRVVRLQIILLASVFGARIVIELMTDWIETHKRLGPSLTVISVFIVGWGTSKIVLYASGSPLVQNTFSRGIRSLLSTLLRFTIFALTLLIALDTMGISITPILASLGVGSIAVALALQDTLGNLFSGLYILVDQPVRIGDTVVLDSGIEGTVSKVGWRSTHLLSGDGNLIVIPNTKLASITITNLSRPEEVAAVFVDAGVAYGSDLAFVEKITLEVALKVMTDHSPASMREGIPPAVRFHTFADSSIKLTATLRADRPGDRSLLKHEFIKALHARYSTEKIVIPLPQRVVQTSPA